MKTMNKTRQQLSEFFIAALKEDRLPWRAVWRTGLPMNPTTGARYRGVNKLLLSMVSLQRGYSDPRWCTFLQAKNHGWSIRKGAKGVQIEYWAYVDPQLQKMLSWEEAWRIQVTDPERFRLLELRYRISTVFNAGEIGGIPDYEKPEAMIAAKDILRCRDTILRNMHLGYREQGGGAYYSPATDQVTLPPMEDFESEYGYVCTFLHECGHATAHPSRLNRPLGVRGTPEYAREELRAEIASAFVSQELGIQMENDAADENLDLHKAYIQGWITELENNPAELYAAIKEADRISDYLIQAGEFQLTRPPERLKKPIELSAGDALLTLKNCYTRGGYSLTVSGSGTLEESTLNSLLQRYRENISELRIEEGISTLGNRVFWKMPGLEYAVLPNSLQRIGCWAMDQCPKLVTVEYHGSIPAWDAIPKGECFLPEQFKNELERARSHFEIRLGNAALTAEGNSGLIFQAEPVLLRQASQQAQEEDFELEL